MAKRPQQKAKLLYLYSLFVEKTDSEHPVSNKEIINYLAQQGINVERKTIYDDIETLQNYGLDIISEKKQQTIYYYLGSRTFELAELKLLVDTIQSSKFLTQNKSNNLIKKIENLASENEAKQLHRQVTVINRVKVNNEKIYYNVDKINNAINDRVQISFYYLEWVIKNKGATKASKQRKRDGKIYVVTPQNLMWDDENYYLVAYESESGKLKHFRVDKMEKVELLEDKAITNKGLEKFDAGLYSKQVFGMYGGKLIDIKLRCKEALIGPMIDRFGDKILIYNNGDGTFDLSVSVMISPQFFAWLFGFKNDIKIISPNSIKNEYLNYLSEVRKIYE